LQELPLNLGTSFISRRLVLLSCVHDVKHTVVLHPSITMLHQKVRLQISIASMPLASTSGVYGAKALGPQKDAWAATDHQKMSIAASPQV